MPRRCCVPSCKSNYDSQNGYVSIFKFPKDPNLKIKWISSISRKNWTPGENSAVCSIHFQENEIIRYDEFTRNDGTIAKNLLKFPKLHKAAVPSIFPNLLKKAVLQNESTCENPIVDQIERKASMENSSSLQKASEAYADVQRCMADMLSKLFYMYSGNSIESNVELRRKELELEEMKLRINLLAEKNKARILDIRERQLALDEKKFLKDHS